MSLEQDIKQPGFRSESHKALLNIIYTANFVQAKMGDVYKKFDITLQQYNVLRILRGQYPGHANVNLIRDRMLDKMSDTSRIIERLQNKKLVIRKKAEKDKRAVEITITDAGLQLLGQMQECVDSFELLLNNLEQEEIYQLNALLDKIRTERTEKFGAIDSVVASHHHDTNPG